jgi:hypothetical protein
VFNAVTIEGEARNRQIEGDVNMKVDLTNLGVAYDVPIFEEPSKVLELVGLEVELVDG